MTCPTVHQRVDPLLAIAEQGLDLLLGKVPPQLLLELWPLLIQTKGRHLQTSSRPGGGQNHAEIHVTQVSPTLLPLELGAISDHHIQRTIPPRGQRVQSSRREALEVDPGRGLRGTRASPHPLRLRRRLAKGQLRTQAHRACEHRIGQLPVLRNLQDHLQRAELPTCLAVEHPAVGMSGFPERKPPAPGPPGAAAPEVPSGLARLQLLADPVLQSHHGDLEQLHENIRTQLLKGCDQGGEVQTRRR